MTYEIVTGHNYTMTAEDFADGCCIVLDAASGRVIGIGEHKLGYRIRTVLNEPLCESCDNPIPADGVCHDCELIHADIGGVTEGDPLLRKDAA